MPLPTAKLNGWFSIDRAIEFLAFLAVFPEPAGVVDLAGLTGLGFGSVAFLGVLILQAALGLLHFFRVDLIVGSGERGDGR